ncbi:MAG TPA: Gfo/Idh/MocA family oxidoreductase [Streptosporangiaceae bacterium]|nr:Gfo/Idh/MocA family oxidoreductase [Streptosporangiaceae bacterium]
MGPGPAGSLSRCTLASDVIGFGVVGVGAIAGTHARAISIVPGARLVAVTDSSLESARRFAQTQPGCEAEPSLDALLARDDVDIVCVCTPSGFHAAVGKKAAQAGKHLVIEKPIDVTLEAADELIETATRAGVQLTVISQHRFDPGLVELRELIGQNRLGTLLLGHASTKWYRTQGYYDSAAWRGTWELDGGSLMNQGIHYVDLLLASLGPVDEVTAISATQAHQIEVEDTALALLRFRNGALGTLVSSTCVYPGFAQRLEVTGTGGTVVIEDGEIVSRGLRADQAASATGQAEPPPPATAEGAFTPAVGDAAHAAQLTDFLSAIRDDRPPAVTAQDGRDALEVVLAVYESSRQGRPIKLGVLR